MGNSCPTFRTSDDGGRIALYLRHGRKLHRVHVYWCFQINYPLGGSRVTPTPSNGESEVRIVRARKRNDLRFYERLCSVETPSCTLLQIRINRKVGMDDLGLKEGTLRTFTTVIVPRGRRVTW